MRDRTRAATTISPKPPRTTASAQVGTASRSVLVLGNPDRARGVPPAPGVVVAATAATGAAVAELGAAVDETGVADEETGVPAGVAVGPTGVGVGTAVADGATVKGGRVGGISCGTAHVDRLIVSLIRVTFAVLARRRPVIVVSFATVICVEARTFPTNVAVEPMKAELTFQNTLQAWAPFVRLTLVAFPTVRSLPSWKIQTALGSPPASNVSVPEERAIALPEVYTPCVRVLPPSSLAATGRPPVRPAASLIAPVSEFFADVRRPGSMRSEERRVGREGGWRAGTDHGTE